MDRTIYDPDRDSEHLDALVAWAIAQSSRAEAVRILSEASGIPIDLQEFRPCRDTAQVGPGRSRQGCLAGVF